MDKDPEATSRFTDADAQIAEQRPDTVRNKSPYAGLGWLDRLLVVWIFLAIVIGILLGNFAEGVSPALQRGKFVGVSIPVGKCPFNEG